MWRYITNLLEYFRRARRTKRTTKDYLRARDAVKELLASNPKAVEIEKWYHGAAMSLQLNPEDVFAQTVVDMLWDRIMIDNIDF